MTNLPPVLPAQAWPYGTMDGPAVLATKADRKKAGYPSPKWLGVKTDSGIYSLRVKDQAETKHRVSVEDFVDGLMSVMAGADKVVQTEDDILSIQQAIEALSISASTAFAPLGTTGKCDFYWGYVGTEVVPQCLIYADADEYIRVYGSPIKTYGYIRSLGSTQLYLLAGAIRTHRPGDSIERRYRAYDKASGNRVIKIKPGASIGFESDANTWVVEYTRGAAVYSLYGGLASPSAFHLNGMKDSIYLYLEILVQWVKNVRLQNLIGIKIL